MTSRQEVRHFLKTGDYDMLHMPWPGGDFLAKARAGDRGLRQALVAEVRRRSKGRPLSSLPDDFDSGKFSLRKVAPMVRGLFPAKEQPPLLDLFEKALVFVTHENIEPILSERVSLDTAWTIANLYLGSLGLPGLDGEPVGFVGLSEETRFFVSMAYFEDDSPFADYVVHEAAHVFHNWKRNRVGLSHTRKREFLLPIDFCKREIFAFACEAYSRILEQARGPADRRRLHADYVGSWLPDVEGVDQSELADILAEAVTARNGWKRVLRRCANS